MKISNSLLILSMSAQSSIIFCSESFSRDEQEQISTNSKQQVSSLLGMSLGEKILVLLAQESLLTKPKDQSLNPTNTQLNEAKISQIILKALSRPNNATEKPSTTSSYYDWMLKLVFDWFSPQMPLRDDENIADQDVKEVEGFLKKLKLEFPLTGDMGQRVEKLGILSQKISLVIKILNLFDSSREEKNAQLESLGLFLLLLDLSYLSSEQNIRFQGEEGPKINVKAVSGKTILAHLIDLRVNFREQSLRFQLNSGVIKLRWGAVHQFYTELIQQGADVNEKDNRGTTLLHKAAYLMDEALCRELISAGAGLDAVDEDGNTPLHVVVLGALDLTERRSLMLSLNRRGNSRELRLPKLNKSMSVNPGELKRMGHMPSNLPESRRSESDTSAFFNRFVQVGGHSDSPRSNSSSLESMTREIICRLFIDEMADTCLNIQNLNGYTPLHLALFANDRRLANLFLDKLADKNVSNSFLQFPLHIACMQDNKHLGKTTSLIEALLQRGAHVTSPDVFGSRPLHYASMRGNNLEFFSKSGKTIDGNLINESGWSLLHIATYYGNCEAIRLLLNYAVDVNMRIPVSGKTALMIACENGDEESCRLLLTQRDLDYKAADSLIGTALHWAVEFEQVGICKILLAHGFADQTAESKLLLLKNASDKANAPLKTVFLETWGDDWSAELEIARRR